MVNRNRLANVTNPYQGQYRKVLCLCSAGLLRSPTAALVLSQDPFNYNTRAAGVSHEYALVPVDEALIAWADEIVCVEPAVRDELMRRFKDSMVGHKLKVMADERQLKVLNVPDQFSYRDPELMNIIFTQYNEVG